jgi:hypothetical protein
MEAPPQPPPCIDHNVLDIHNMAKLQEESKLLTLLSSRFLSAYIIHIYNPFYRFTAELQVAILIQAK